MHERGHECGADPFLQTFLNNFFVPLVVFLGFLLLPLIPSTHRLLSAQHVATALTGLFMIIVPLVMAATSVGNTPRTSCDEVRNEQSSGVAAFIIVPIGLLGYKVYQWRVLSRRRLVLEGPLSERLRDGSIRLVSVRWLLAQPEGYTLRRRQDLPTEALVPPDAAVALLQSGHVAVLSYRWLTAAHPDPDGFHMRAVRGFFAAARGRPHRWRALFWDFGSCHQKERTDEETAAFKLALSVMTRLYASPLTCVLQHKRLPADFPNSQPTYELSGWCTMEQAAASLATESGGTLHDLGVGWVRLTRGKRRSPSEMAAIFADEGRTRFVGKADRATVAQMYAELHALVAEFDERTMPMCVRALDRLVFLSSKRAVPFITAVLVICIAFYLFLITRNPDDPSFGWDKLFIGLLLCVCVPLACCLPSRIVRDRVRQAWRSGGAVSSRGSAAIAPAAPPAYGGP